MKGRRVRRQNLYAVDLTVLSWRRTTFQVALAALAIARMLTDDFGWWMLAAGAAGVGLALAVHASVSAYVATIDEHGHVLRRPGAIGHALVRQALVAGGTAALCIAALAWVMLQV